MFQVKDTGISDNKITVNFQSMPNNIAGSET